MTTLTLSGYLATATAVTWAAGQTLTSLTDNEYTDLSDEIDNSAGGTFRVLSDVYIELGSAAFTGTDSALEVFLVPSVDGTNYPTWTGNGTADEQENAAFLVGAIITTGTTAAQKGVIRNVELPNGKFKWGFRNRGNVTLAATANTVYWRPHSYAD